MIPLDVHCGEAKVGRLAEARGGIVFEYIPAWIASGHELSPLQLALGPGLRARETRPTMRLPGLFEDSLPDQWGERVMTAWFRQRGQPAHAITPLQKLAYVGSRAMGALQYEPSVMPDSPDDPAVDLGSLYRAAADLESSGTVDLEKLAVVGSSAGGARPKALVALPRANTGPILAGAGMIPPSHEAWIVKFDTSREGTSGPMEEAFARMARAAGIDVPATRLLETQHRGKTRRHFAVKRFDREAGERVHHHTLAGLVQAGAGDLDYSLLLRVARRLTRDEGEVWRAFRRAAFNVLASNRDDHGKNHGFLYRDRVWQLGPAYDLTFASPAQLPERGMAILGERRGAGPRELLKLAVEESLDSRAAATVIDEVRAAVRRWRKFASDAGVPTLQAAEIEHALRSTLSTKSK